MQHRLSAALVPWIALWVGASAQQSPAQLAHYRDEQGGGPALELVESEPSGCGWDDPAIPNAADVWLELIGRAQVSLDLAQFYISDAPAGPSLLRPVLDALIAAAGRGVEVRVLVDAKFVPTYPQPIGELDALPGIEVRKLDFGRVAGGVMHAKYFVVDARPGAVAPGAVSRPVAYLGSQNFDWRSLEHIQELGLCLRAPQLVQPLQWVFDLDWAAGEPLTGEQQLEAAAPPAGTTAPVAFESASGTSVAHWVGSPQGHLPGDESWELPQLVALIDSAQQRVRVQVLTYKASSRQDGYFAELETALRRAAARNVEVELLVADWGKRKGTIEGLQSLEVLPKISVKLVTVPQAAEGFVPFARVVHAKYLVVDGRASWLGTSNWEGDYFTRSRNVGVIVEGGALPAQLDAFFARGWARPEAVAVDPGASYNPPRIGE